MKINQLWHRKAAFSRFRTLFLEEKKTLSTLRNILILSCTLFEFYVSLSHFVTFSDDTMTAFSITNFIFLTFKKKYEIQVKYLYICEKGRGCQKENWKADK